MGSVEPAPKKAEKAEFKAVEKEVKLENIPELDAQGQAEKKKGRFGRPIREPAKEEEKPASKTPKVTPDQALRPTLEMAAMKWNQFLEAPVGDEKNKYRWDERDTDMLIKALTALDAKYNFMANWLDYMPEMFAVIVVGGILAKLVMGARWNAQSDKMKPAAGQEGPVKPANPAGIVERVREKVAQTLQPKPPGEKDLMAQMPPELIQAGKDYLK